MIWLIGRLMAVVLLGAEAWALWAGERQLVDLFAVLGLGVLAVAWVLAPGEFEENGR